MKLSAIDANLLVALDALLRERSVTRAAARIGVGQPALSHSLARLRAHFNDPLLIRKGREMVLSDKASKLAPSVASASSALVRVFEQRAGLDLGAPRTITLAAIDLFSILLIPKLARTLQETAPALELEVRPLAARSTEAILSDGVDLAFGSFEDVPSEINQGHLFRDPFVCVVRADHPHVGPSLSLTAYVRLSHLEVRPAPGTRPGARIDRLLAAKGLQRRVTMRVPYFALAARVLATSDHVLTMTRRFALQLAGLAPLRIVKCPLPIAPLSFSQIWRRELDDDPAHRWLREACARICAKRDAVD